MGLASLGNDSILLSLGYLSASCARIVCRYKILQGLLTVNSIFFIHNYKIVTARHKWFPNACLSLGSVHHYTIYELYFNLKMVSCWFNSLIAAL